MGGIKGFDKSREESKNLNFFKIFQTTDLSSETMRAFPYSFTTKMSEEDLSNKMVIRAIWGSSWEVGVSKNPIFYYMEKHGWNKFVTDNGFGENEFVTFTHKGKMCFDVNIYEQSGTEMLKPRKLKRFGSSSEVKKGGESSYKDVKKEEETGKSHGEKRREGSKRKRVVEKGESSGGVKLKGRKTKEEETKNKKKDAPSFRITIRKSYLSTSLPIPRHFQKHIPATSKNFTIHHSDGKHSRDARCLVGKNSAFFSSGWRKIARECHLLIGDVCTFKLISPSEFRLTVDKIGSRNTN